MLISAALIPGWLSIPVWVFWSITLAFAVRYADWRALRSEPSRYHLLFGGTLFCVLLWLMTVRVVEGLWIHLLGATALTLILGWRFAIIAGSVAVLIHTAFIAESLLAAAPAWLLTVAVPVTVSRGLVHLLQRLKSRNLFIYMLGAGFGGGMLSVIAAAVVAVSLLWLIDQGGWVEQALSNWQFIALVLFPEGFINGMMITALSVFYPDLLKTFDDKRYLGDE